MEHRPPGKEGKALRLGGEEGLDKKQASASKQGVEVVVDWLAVGGRSRW